MFKIHTVQVVDTTYTNQYSENNVHGAYVNHDEYDVICMPASQHSTCWQLFHPDISTAHFYFFVAEVMSNYLTTDGLKKISLLLEAPPEA